MTDYSSELNGFKERVKQFPQNEGDHKSCSPNAFPIYIFQDIYHTLADEEINGVLTFKLLACGLSDCSYFGKTKVILTKLILKNANLVNVNLLESFVHLNYLDLSENCLEKLPIFKFGFQFLKYFDCSHNNLSSIPSDFCKHYSSLNSLKLSNNKISQINGLEGLHFLHTLDLSGNRLHRLENLACLNIVELNVSDNKIKIFVKGEKGLSSNKNLLSVNLDNNMLKTLDIFEKAFFIGRISMASNELKDPEEILCLRNLIMLRELNLRKNPLTNWCLYESYTLSVLKNLTKLDGKTGEDLKFEPKFEILFWERYMQMYARQLITQYFNNIPRTLHKDNIMATGSGGLIRNILVILVGTSGTYLEDLCKHITCRNSEIKLLKKVTTSLNSEIELCNNVSVNEFNELSRRGEFVAVVENLGTFHGFRHVDILCSLKHYNICLTDMDLKGAMCMRAAGYEPFLLLVTMENKELHERNLLRRYEFHVFQNTEATKIIEKPMLDNRNCNVYTASTNSKNSIFSQHQRFHNCENENSKYFNQSPYLDFEESASWLTSFKSYIFDQTSFEVDNMFLHLHSEEVDLEEKRERQRITEVIDQAKHIFVKENIDLAEFYRNVSRKHTDIFYSVITVSDDLEVDVTKIQQVISTIIKNHTDEKLSEYNIKADPLYETLLNKLMF